MPRRFPADTSELTVLSSDDKFLVSDTSASAEGKEFDAKGLLIPVTDGGGGGRNMLTSADINIVNSAVHTSNILGGGTSSLPNSIGRADHPTHTDGDYPGGTLPNHATIIGSYDQVNNQQATLLASPHSFAPAAGGGTGHNAAVGGSWNKVDGSYNFIGGGGGSLANQNETGVNAVKSCINAGHGNYIDGDYCTIGYGIDNTIGTGYQYSFAGGRDAVMPSSYARVHSSQGILVAGDSQMVELLFRGRTNSTSLTSLALAGTTTYFIYRDIPINVGATLNVAFGGTVEITATRKTGTGIGLTDRYTINFGLHLTGTQGATSGWTATWNNGDTGATMPAALLTSPGALNSPEGPNIPVTVAPRIDANATGIIRLQVQANTTTDEIMWHALWRTTMTAW